MKVVFYICIKRGNWVPSKVWGMMNKVRGSGKGALVRGLRVRLRHQEWVHKDENTSLAFKHHEVHHRGLYKGAERGLFCSSWALGRKAALHRGSPWLSQTQALRDVCAYSMVKRAMVRHSLSVPYGPWRQWPALISLFSYVRPTPRIVFETKLLINSNKWMN